MQMSYWLNEKTAEYFDAPIQEILDERQPASIGKCFLSDLLEERHPELFTLFKPKVISQCIDVSLKKAGYRAISKRNKTYWRTELCQSQS